MTINHFCNLMHVVLPEMHVNLTHMEWQWWDHGSAPISWHSLSGLIPRAVCMTCHHGQFRLRLPRRCRSAELPSRFMSGRLVLGADKLSGSETFSNLLVFIPLMGTLFKGRLQSCMNWLRSFSMETKKILENSSQDLQMPCLSYPVCARSAAG